MQSLRTSVLSASLFLLACDDTTHEAPTPAPIDTRGGAIVLTSDDRIAVATHRSAGTISVCQLALEGELSTLLDPSACTTLDLGKGSEPWAATIGADDDTAYAILRQRQLLVRIDNLHRAPHLSEIAIQVGAEPTALAIAPSGQRVFVANWAEGTISVVTTQPFALQASLDLNPALQASGQLAAASSRPALAHPRALAITNSGDRDDGDETLYATEFFSQPNPDPGAREDPDRNRQGLIYPIRFSENGVIGTPIALAPIDTGFPTPQADAGAPTTTCVPNQLYAAAAVGSRLFVTSMCASPSGPVASLRDLAPDPAHFQTVVHPTLFVVDPLAQRELTDQHVVLTRALQQRYEADQVAPGDVRMPLIPNDLVFAARAPGQPAEGCLTAAGANAVFCFRFGDGGLIDVGSQDARYTALNIDKGALPVGLALSGRKERPFLLAVSDRDAGLSVVDLASGKLVIDHTLEVLHADPAVNAGRELFATGLRGWSYNGQAWSSCESCHPDGLSDGLTWFFARGPRRTLSTAGTFDAQGNQRLLLWGANLDEVHDVETIVRTVSGGVGAMLWTYSPEPNPGARLRYSGESGAAESKQTSTLHNNLNGSLKGLVSDAGCGREVEVCDATPIEDWDQIEAYLRSVRAPRAPTNLDAQKVVRGAQLFAEGRCASCHGGASWTASRLFYQPGPEPNGKLPFVKPVGGADSSILGTLRQTRYDVAAAYLSLNPPLRGPGGLNDNAPLRSSYPALYESYLDHAYDPEVQLADQINCALYDVGTFPEQAGAPNALGIAPRDGAFVHEVRANMRDLALGATGFNAPSLLGLSVGAPYFHAGNARSLEEAFDLAFARHYGAAKSSFLVERSSDDVAALVAYLLSIDDATTAQAGDPALTFCPAHLMQTPP